MTSLLRSLVTAALLLVLTMAPLTLADTSLDHGAVLKTRAFNHLRHSLSQQQQQQRRRLQIVPIPPTRQCGQDLGVTPRDVIGSLVTLVTQAFGGAGSAAGIGDALTIDYDVQAFVLRGSCEQTATSAATAEMLADTGSTGFASYCAQGMHGYNATHSGLLLVPVDPDTGEIIANKRLKGSVFAHSLQVDTSMAPSEVFPEDLAAFIENAPDPALAFGALINVVGALFAASAGVVSIVPDYIGFGQSSSLTKSLSAKLYRQASIPLWLEAQALVSNITNGCTELDNVATVGGYSEGGYASFAIAQARDKMGVSILSCNSGAAAWDVQDFLQWHLNDFDGGNVNPTVALIMAYVGTALSSTDPDLANSDVGQDMILDEWMDETDFAKWAQGWISSDLLPEEAAAYVPLPDYVQMFNPNITSMFRNATAMNVSDACSLAVVGETDKFCETAIESDLSDDILSPKFPVVLCHSPDDEVIPYDALFPDVSASDNLTEFSLLGQFASGSHAEAYIFCLIPMILPFTEFNTGPSSIAQVPLDTCVSPTAPAPPTTSDLPTMEPPTAAPDTSSGYRYSCSVFAALAAMSFVWLAL